MRSLRSVRAAATTLAAATLLTSVAVAAPSASAASASCPTPERSVVSTTPARYAKTVALTFDDGPSAFTPKVLAVLKAKGVHATFFVTGRDARKSPAVLRQIVAAGHKLGNHSDTHPQNTPGSSPRASFDALPSKTQAAQMDATTKAIVAATGQRPCFFRAPGGNHWKATTLTLSKARQMSVINWAADTRDWAQPGKTSASYTAGIVKAATGLRTTHPVILFHDGKASPEPESKVSSNRSNTVAALPKVIDYYKARGYVFTDPTGRVFPKVAVITSPKPAGAPVVKKVTLRKPTPRTAGAPSTVISFVRVKPTPVQVAAHKRATPKSTGVPVIKKVTLRKPAPHAG